VSNRSLSSLTAASTLTGDELIYLIQSGNSRKLTISDLTTHLGSSFQPLDSDLTAIAALSTTTYGRSLLTLADNDALAAEISEFYQPLDADLTAIAALSPSNDDIIQRKAGVWVNRTMTQLASDLDSFFLTPAEGNAAYQPLDSDLTAIAALSTTTYGRTFLTLTGNIQTKVATAAVDPRIQSIGTDNETSSFLAARFQSGDAGGPIYYLAKSRHATPGSHTIVQDGDNLGSISWAGSDGTDFAEGARITAQVDGTPGAGDMPTRLVFLLSADGSESPTERARITTAGYWGLFDTTPTSPFTVKANSLTGPHIDVWCDDGVRQPDIAATGYGAAGGGIFHSKRARGDKTTPTQLLSGDEIGGYGGRPYTSGGSFTPSSPASIHFLVAEDQTATANAALIRFLTTPIGSTYADRKTRLQITHDGVVWAIDEGTHSFLVTRQTKPWSDARFLASGEGASGQFGASVGAVMYGGASNLTAGFRGGTARGTAATPTATQADDFLVFLGGHGYETTTPGFSSGSRGLFGIKATENFTSTAQGTYATIETTPASSTTRAERVRVTAAGQHVVGHTAALATTLATASVTPRSQTVGTDNATSSFLGARFSADSGGPVYYLGKSRHATAGSHTVVQDGDNLGSISWAGSDGTDFAEGARVTAQVDGTPGSGDMPTRMLFYTSADGSESPTERMRITSAGLVSLTGSFGRSAPVTKTADFTLDATENYVINNRAATNTATLPAASSWTGREVFMKTIQAQAVVSASSNVVPSTSATAGTAILPATDGAWALLVSDGTNWVIVAANPLV
jgi:hypothetical protein